MKNTRILIMQTLLLSAVLLNFSCEDRFYKEKYNIKYFITNKTDTTIHELKVADSYNEKE